jgi:hypothetical protein
LLSPTLAEAVKEATQGKGKVVSLSLKDRSAILPGGRSPDVLCFWADDEGRFVSSNYYNHPRRDWVTAFNASGFVDRWRGKTWERLLAIDYTPWSGPDDGPDESTGFSQGRIFPHPFDRGPETSRKKYFDALSNSPFGNDILLELTRRAIDAEQLGSRDIPDLLCVSFSSNDYVGHAWGPDSHEVLDITLRTDQIIRDLLTLLDDKVGKGAWTLALSADHGICPLPQAPRAALRPAGARTRRIRPDPLLKDAEAYLDKTFGSAQRRKDGKGGWIEHSVSNMMYFNRPLLAKRNVKPSDAETALARWLTSQKGILAAYTRTELLSGGADRDDIGKRVRASFHPDRSGDVMFVLEPYCLLSASLTGTDHGSPHNYDTYVPLLVYGPNIKPAKRGDPVSPEAAAVVLAQALGIRPPAQARVGVPDGLFATAE